ncbi:hypothetical protein ABZ756_03790 [Mammaliicoccus sciuri]
MEQLIQDYGMTRTIIAAILFGILFIIGISYDLLGCISLLYIGGAIIIIISANLGWLSQITEANAFVMIAPLSGLFIGAFLRWLSYLFD